MQTIGYWLFAADSSEPHETGSLRPAGKRMLGLIELESKLRNLFAIIPDIGSA